MSNLRIVFIVCIAFLLSAPVIANNKTSERINGVADFLLERANDNYLYIFQRKIQSNKALACYFPTTYDNLTVGGDSSLKRLLTSRDLWKESIQSDLEFLTIRSLAVEIESTLEVSKNSVVIASTALDFINQVSLLDNGKLYDLNVIDPNMNTELKRRINGFTDGLGQFVVDLNKFRRYQQLCPAPVISMAEFKKEFDSLRQLNSNLRQWYQHIELNASDLRLKDGSSSWGKMCEAFGVPASNCIDSTSTVKAFKQYKLQKLVNPQILKNISIIGEVVDAVRNNKQEIINAAIKDAVCLKLGIAKEQCTDKHTLKVAVREIVNGSSLDSSGQTISKIDAELLAKVSAINQVANSIPSQSEDITSQVFKALKKINKQHESHLQKLEKKSLLEPENKSIQEIAIALNNEIEGFDKLSRHILFFASVADANSANEVKSILTNYTLPSVSFFEKRKQGNHFMVTSYLGLSYNVEEESASTQSNNGLFVPIGLEYSRGVNWLNGSLRSVSVMFSPVDFGHPINLKLNDLEDDFELDEIIAPSVTFAVGLNDYPLTLGVGYQKGRQLEASNESENRVILFFAFDMPLLNLHGD